jgi:response regulator RpfG family c-di-GMP phosphodiesterase
VLGEIAARKDAVAVALRSARVASPEDLGAVLAELHHERPALLAHARRVARSAGRLARELGVASLAVIHIERAALVHDLGKLVLPETLASATGPFTAQELVLVRSHPALGAELVAAVPYLHAAAPLVAATHERFGGGGHAQGSAGAAIPLGARLIAVADAWDAFAGGLDECDAGARACANLELVRHAGSHFDPAVVRAWLRVSGTEAC